MLFNSAEFFVFFTLVVAGAWALASQQRARILFLTAASYYFYMCWNWKFASLIAFSTFLDFEVGRRIHQTASRRRRQALLLVSLIGNLGCLGVFKYYNFFASSAKATFDAIGLSLPISQWEIILPVGISFYTFQTLSYTIDIYRGHLKPTDSLLGFGMFVAFFPQLVAGPIVRASEFLPQLERRPEFDDRGAQDGLALMLFGLFKKVCIADVLAVTLVDPVFGDPGRFSGLTLLLAVYGYAMQIYCDFSGYSDIAIGAARVLGFELPINFNRPYLARSVTEFWQRWHISLSTWLRDYLYISLGGNRKGRLRTYMNLMTTMLIGGLWHGAAWNFVIWGGLHGIYLAVERIVWGGKPELPRDSPWAWNSLLRGVVTFHLVCLAWILFRARSAESGFLLLERILVLAPGTSGLNAPFLLALMAGFMLHFTPPAWKDALRASYLRLPVPYQAGVVTATLLFFVIVGVGNTPFIYFQF